MNGATSNSEEKQNENKPDMNQDKKEEKGKKDASIKSKNEKNSGQEGSNSKGSKTGKKSDKKEDKTERKSAATVTHVQYTEAMTMVLSSNGIQIFKEDDSTDNSQNAIDDDNDYDDYTDNDMDTDDEVHREDYLNQTVAKYEGSDISWTDDDDDKMESEIVFTNKKEMTMVFGSDGLMTVVTNDDENGVERCNYISTKATITELPDDCDDTKVTSQL